MLDWQRSLVRICAPYGTNHMLFFDPLQSQLTNELLFSCPVVSNFVTLWIAAHQASLSLTISRSLPKFVSIASVMPPSHLILWYSLLLLFLIFPSTEDFSSESAFHIRWPKCWSFSFSISPPNGFESWFLLRLAGLISLLSKGFSGVFSSTTVQRHQFFGTLLSLHPKVEKWKSLSHVQFSLTPWTVTCHAPLSMDFSRPESWRGLPFPSPEDLPNPGIKPRSPALQADSLLSEPLGSPLYTQRWAQ